MLDIVADRSCHGATAVALRSDHGCLGLVLIPDAATSAAITEFARVVVPNVGEVRSVLGDGALPHVTLAHVRSEQTSEAVWKEVHSWPTTAAELTLAGLRFNPEGQVGNRPATISDGLAVYLQILVNQSIAALQDRLLLTSWFEAGKCSPFRTVDRSMKGKPLIFI